MKKNFQRGHGQTSDISFRNSLFESCQSIVAEKDATIKPSIKIDYDAISILISLDGTLQKQSQKSLQDFLLGFGCFATAISVPHFGILCQGESSIFGCSRNKCQQLPLDIQSSEVIVCDTPVKISVHKSCKLTIIDFLKKKGFPVSAAPNDDICIDPKKATNLPYFGLLLEAIIYSCNNSEKNFIHVANVGIRIPIQAVIAPSDLTNPESSIDRLFSDIKQLRSCNETTVEILQLDIAFTLPHPKGEFMTVHASKVANDENTNPTLLSKSNVVTYPMYTDTYDASPNGKNKKKNGTVLIKTKKKSTAMTTLVSSECCDNDHPDHNFIFEKMKTSDKTETDTKENVEMYTNNLYSIKMYSNHIHKLSQFYGSVPRTQRKMHYLPDRTVRQLTSMLDAVWKTFNNTVEYTKSVGVGLRSEVSIRPVMNTDESSLRLTGHLNDFLMVAYFSLFDVYRGAYRVGKKTVSIEHTRTRLITLIEQLRPCLHLRASTPFNIAYPNKSRSLWLQAQIGQIMNLAGFAQLFYYDYVIKWLKSATCYDPSGDRKLHIITKPVDVNAMETCLEETPKTRAEEFSSLLQKLKTFFNEHKFSTQDIGQLLSLIGTTPLSGEGSLLCFTKLSYQGKLLFLSIAEDIIPLIANLESSNDSMDEGTKSGHGNAMGEVEGEYPEDDMECEEDFERKISYNPPTKEYEFLLLQPDPTKSTSISPYTQIIRSIDQLNSHIYFGSPAFKHYLFTFIIKCHEERLSLPCQNAQTNNKIQLTEISCDCKKILAQESPVSLQQLRYICKQLSVPMIGINIKAELLIKALSAYYFFPCHGVAYNTTNLQFDCSYFVRANLFLNEILNKDVAISLPGPRPTSHHTFHRPTENKTISILRPEHLVIPCRTNYQSEDNNDSENGYESLRLYLNLSSTEHLRQMISDHLKGTICLDNSFLLENGLKNPAFEGMTNLQDIEMKHSILIGWPMEASPDNLGQYYQFAPKVIIPLISFIYEMDITFYNLSSQKTMIYTFNSSKKSVLYTFDTLNLTPTIDTTIVIHRGNSLYSLPKLTRHTQSKNTFQSLSHHHLNPSNSQNTIPTVRCLKDHAWKPSGNKSQSMSQSLVKAMGDIEYNLEDYPMQEVFVNDPFNLAGFLNEFSSTDEDWVHLMKTLFFHDQTQYDNQVRVPLQKEDFIKRVISDDGQNDHTLLCPIFTLKFKISVTIWNSNKPPTTHHYSYCNRKSNIKYDTCLGYQHQHKHNWGQLLYITVGRSKDPSKKYGHFISPCPDSISENPPPILYNVSLSGQASTTHQSSVMFNHIRKLNFAYSPTNKIFRSLVYKHFVKELRMKLHEFDKLPTDGTECFDLKKRQIVAIHHVLDNKAVDFSCLISFPSACDKSKCIPFLISGDKDNCMEKAYKSSTEALNILSGQIEQKEMYKDIVHLTYGNVPLLGGFIFLVHMFLAQESNSPERFEDSIKQLHKEKDILEKVKLWTTQYLYNGNVNPMWLNNILPKADRNHEI